MGEIPSYKRDEIIELVKKQKKAKINWISMITQVSEESIVQHVDDFGLKIEGEYIFDPSQFLEEKADLPTNSHVKKSIKSRLYQPTITKNSEIVKDSTMSGTISLSLAALSLCAAPIIILILFLIVKLSQPGNVSSYLFFTISYLCISSIASILSCVGAVIGLYALPKGTAKLGLIINCIGCSILIPQTIILSSFWFF